MDRMDEERLELLGLEDVLTGLSLNRPMGGGFDTGN